MALKFNMASWNVRNIKKVVLLDLNIIDNIAKRWTIGNHTFHLDLHKSRNLREYFKKIKKVENYSAENTTK
jgi:hypothetical protein